MLTSGFGKRVPTSAKADESPSTDDSVEAPSAAAEGNAFDTFTKGFLDSSRNAVRTVQLKARHLVSQNKRRYQVSLSFLPFTTRTFCYIALISVVYYCGRV
jgi:phosphatidylinositol-3,4,5-trisphosphate 3-phosphatase/dual-specificity protein phosphatase PTEN